MEFFFVDPETGKCEFDPDKIVTGAEALFQRFAFCYLAHMMSPVMEDFAENPANSEWGKFQTGDDKTKEDYIRRWLKATEEFIKENQYMVPSDEKLASLEINSITISEDTITGNITLHTETGESISGVIPAA